MAAPSTNEEFLELVRKSGVVDEKRLDTHMKGLRAGGNLTAEPGKLAGILVRDGILTHFQAEQFLLGKWRRFTIGKYKVLERLGSGGMGSVYLCEHKFMRRRVAVKVLPAAKAEDPSSLERFYREARAAAALDHPNIVRAYDIDQDENLHFLVMEYVDGASLHEIIKKRGPMDTLRAAHYIRQAAIGLQHAHEAGLVHRDIKPGNLLVDRNGTVKVLDMGLARFFHDEEDILTKKYDESVLGTADYLAPEQALDSHGVDVRADIYSLGATFYYLLTGHPPFSEGTVAQKLIWHQTRQPKAIRALRRDVPEGLLAIVEKMMAKDPAQRYQEPVSVAEALTQWTETPIPPPPEAEMPRLSIAAVGAAPGDTSQQGSPRASSGLIPTPLRKVPGGAAPVPPGKGPSAEIRSESRSATASLEAPRKTAEASGLPDPALGTRQAPASANGQASPPSGTTDLDEEGPVSPWDHLAADTDDASARADTTTQARAHLSPKPTRLAGRNVLRALQEHPWFWLGVAGAAVATLVIIAGLVWLVFHGFSPSPPTTPAVKIEAVLVVRQSADGP
ncbi:MAG TPA: protein kinase, partial [Gemmataceae bacterium]|nr:protein kinase [Gemmataceae bacterium]